MSRKILGLDIRQDSVTAVMAKSGIKGNWIEGHAHVPMPGQEDIENRLTAAMETITDKMDVAGSVCVASFPANQVSYRNIRLPFKDRRKIRQIIPFELEPALPFPVEEMITDFHIIPDYPADGDTRDHTNIIATAVEKNKLKSYLDVLTSFKTEPEIITVGGYPTGLCLAKFADIPENCIFMDIEAVRCTVFVIISGQTYMMRSFPINSNTGKTRSICTDIQRLLASFDEMLGPDLNFYPDEIYITGYGIEEGFEQEAERFLEIPIKRADIIRDTGTVIKTHPTTSMKTPAQMDNGFSLALLEIQGISALNFRRGDYAPKKQWAEHKSSFIKIAILAGLVLIAGFSNMMIESHYMEKKLATLDEQIETIFKRVLPDTPIVNPSHQVRVKIGELGKNISPGEMEGNVRTVDILNDISTRIPKEIDVKLTRLVIGQGNVLISGDTDTYNAVDDVKNKLESSNFFKQVTISSSNIDKRANRVRFKLKALL
ncbi:pilus assembly protein PilM [Desulfococcaceae bacterium HSG8]|nr:pilus assembly protein PilM [Desulfococcaceae bacterium HSG8]